MSGFSRNDQLYLANPPQQGSLPTIVLISLCQVIEMSLMIMVITSSWRDYRKANRSCSCLGFFRTLAKMRKVSKFYFTTLVEIYFEKKSFQNLSSNIRIF